MRVGSVTLMDDRLVNEEALNANFLIPPDENAYRGKTMAEICCVVIRSGTLTLWSLSLLRKFDVVVIGYGSRATKMSVNEQCRKLSKRVAFYTVDCRDSCGEIFVDLQDYKYTKAPKKGVKVATKKKPEKVTNHLFERRPKQFGVGGALPPKKYLTGYIKWPKSIRLQRQKRILKQRLKVPPELNQFSTKTLDKNLGMMSTGRSGEVESWD
ncbi:hypothetical protein Bca52824_075640 [Brassica carinata]|uniref:60S ribosomal protein L7a n=1 Tax=Brassica carinata TaxID=52824 RepID=A0A8X7PQS7_BRACI|nr:hypothetical protein Bca52824_075640 [Brassica carinata]